MSPKMYKRKARSQQNHVLKKTIKFLSICKNPHCIHTVIKAAPDKVIKTICNAALNAAQGEDKLRPNQKRILSANRHFVRALIAKGESVSKKRKVLFQKGGALPGLILPVILSAVLSSIGSRIFVINEWRV